MKLFKPGGGRSFRTAEEASLDPHANKSLSVRRRELVKATFGVALGGLAFSSVTTARARIPDTGISRGAEASTENLKPDGIHLLITNSGPPQSDPFSGGAGCAILIKGRILQFNLGRGAVDKLMLTGIDPCQMEELYFTRIHYDYVSDYRHYFHRLSSCEHKEVRVFGPPGTKEMVDRTARGLQELTQSRSPNHTEVCRGAVCKVTELAGGIVGQKGLYDVTATRVHHADGGISLAYRIDSQDGSIAIGTGAEHPETIIELAAGVDILLYECTNRMVETTSELDSVQISSYGGSAPHASLAKLGQLARAAHVRTLVPCHLPHTARLQAASLDLRPDWYNEGIASIKQSYKGRIVVPEDGMILSL